MRYRKYTFLFIALTLLTALSITAFNYVIDPYGKNNIFTSVFNKKKAIRDERISKFEMLEAHPQATSFLFGSSKVLMLDPELFEKATGTSTLNMAFSSASADEYYLYIKYILQTRNVDYIVIGIDLFAYTDGYNSSGTLPQKLRNYFHLDDNYSLGNYLSYSMLRKSIKTLKVNLKNRTSRTSKYTVKGKVLGHGKVKLKNGIIDEPPRWGTKYYTLSQESLNKLAEIHDLCQTKNAKLHLFMTPIYIKQITMKNSMFPVQQKLLKYIVEHITNVWDYNDLSNINTDPYAYTDVFHFTYQVSDMILNQLMGHHNSHNKYKGHYVTKESINNYLSKIQNKLKALP